jgi:hypothetical protein
MFRLWATTGRILAGPLILAITSCTGGGTRAAPSDSPSAAPSSSASSSPSASPSPEALPKRPVSQARVEGKFRGFGLFSDKIDFTPKCRKGGGCDVVGNAGNVGAVFDFEGHGYVADYSFHETCASGGISTPLEIAEQFKFRISKAAYDENDEWRATQLKVIQRVNSPGAKKTVTGTTSIQTLTCNAIHEKDKGTMSLSERI